VTVVSTEEERVGWA